MPVSRLLPGLCVMLLVGPLLAQGPVPASAQSTGTETLSDTEPLPGKQIRVFLITMGPGRAAYEKFGHNALWIHDPFQTDPALRDPAYNWGMFDFEQENFFLRFVQGRMLYRLESFDAGLTLKVYRKEDRTLRLQELNLLPAQKLALQAACQQSDTDEHRFYLYDYYRDNCSTRIRDYLDRALDGQIAGQTKHVPAGTTLRWHTDRLIQTHPLIYIFLKYALGQPVDEPISQWQEMFLPERLADHLGSLTVRDEAGNKMPLVLSDQVIHRSEQFHEPQAPPTDWPVFLTLGLLVGGTLAATGHVRMENRILRRIVAVKLGLWAGFVAFFGSFLIPVWLWTDHVVARWNENPMQFSPLAWPLVVYLPQAYLGRIAAQRKALIWTLIVLGCALVGLVWKTFSVFDQANGPIIAFALPAHTGLVYAAWMMRQRTPSVSSTKAESPRSKR